MLVKLILHVTVDPEVLNFGLHATLQEYILKKLQVLLQVATKMYRPLMVFIM